MTAYIYKVNDRNVLFGLDWKVVSDPATEKRELKSFIDQTEALFQVRHEASLAIVYGFASQNGLPANPKKLQLVSAAMLLATMPEVPPNAIFLDVTGQGARLAVIENGVPAAGGDMVAPAQDVVQFIEELRQDTGKDFTIYGNCTEVFANAIPLNLEELVSEGNVEAATLVKVKRELPTKMIALLILALGGGGGLLYYDEYQQEQKAQLLATLRNKPAVDPSIAYKQSVEKSLSTAGIPASDASRVLATQWRHQETLIGGWALKTIECVAETCTYQWLRKGGTNASLKAGVDDIPLRYINADEVNYTLPVREKQAAFLQLRQIAPYDYFQEKTGSFLQDLRLIGMTVPDLGKADVFGADPSLKVSALKSPILYGKLSIEGPVALLDQVLDGLPDAITFKRIVVTPENDGPKFKLEGNYHVKD